jgi:hypothetical protein
LCTQPSPELSAKGGTAESFGRCHSDGRTAPCRLSSSVEDKARGEARASYHHPDLSEDFMTHLDKMFDAMLTDLFIYDMTDKELRLLAKALHQSLSKLKKRRAEAQKRLKAEKDTS